ncbi:MAG: AraC family transcriptional regulator [Hymenobacteraceae bacterium]|nr:AraC family transcriptional regulator [Hymenobacteraceae bacterium]
MQPLVAAPEPLPGTQRLFIRHMVCPRCVFVVREELKRLGYAVADVALGTADVYVPADGGLPDAAPLRAALAGLGFSLLTDPQDQLVEQIKAAVIELVHVASPDARAYNASYYLSEKLGRDYRALSHAFSARAGLTLEKFIIRQRIERAKELLSYPDGVTIAEVAAQLGYSSAAHLANQFRQITGMSPTAFRALGPGSAGRQSLDQVG